MRLSLLATVTACLICSVACGDEPIVVPLNDLIGKSFQAADTMDIGIDPSDDAMDCLRGLTWKPSKFTTSCVAPTTLRHGDLLIRFPSPLSSGDADNDNVSMEWYVARDDSLQPKRANAVVIVHESGKRMPVGRMFARGLHQRGFHTFLLHLPYYGDRRAGVKKPDDAQYFSLIRQAIADVRRARDAVASLPFVDDSHIALQGTSLGGIVSATSASMDQGYDSVFLTLAGGDIFDLIQNGQKDAAKVREKLNQAGISGEQLRSIIHTIEPTRIAHRLRPERTWLHSGVYDTVVPMENARALADAANLADSHHIQMWANHFTGIIFLPIILDHIRDQMNHLRAADSHEQSQPVTSAK